jgi:hypothetical protein
VIDFTALEHPVFAGEIYLGPGMNALKTQVENDRLYLVGSNTENYKNPASSEEAINSFLKIYDINNPAQPEELGIYDLEQGIYGLYRSFQIQDEIGYFLKYPRAGWAPPDFDVVDLRDPTQPTLIARYSDSFLYRFRLQDNFLYRVTEYQDKAGKGFDILDATNPVSITLLSSINISTTFGYVPGFDVSENYAYIGVEDDATKALHIIDISDPLLPLPGSIYTLTNIPSQPFLEAIEVNGNLALVGYTWGLQLLDITQPLAPVHLSDIEICGEIVDLQMVADRVYVACRSNGAQIIDISDPSHPQIIREYGGTITGINTGVDLPVYLSAYNDGLLIYKQPPFGD